MNPLQFRGRPKCPVIPYQATGTKPGAFTPAILMVVKKLLLGANKPVIVYLPLFFGGNAPKCIRRHMQTQTNIGRQINGVANLTQVAQGTCGFAGGSFTSR